MLSVYLWFSEKNRYSPTRQEKCHFHCSFGQITPFPNKFTFFMNRMNQYMHSVSSVWAPTTWIFNKLSKSKPDSVRVQWGYCWRGVRVIETSLYEYWPDRQFKNLIVLPLLLSTHFLSFSQISSRCHICDTLGESLPWKLQTVILRDITGYWLAIINCQWSSNLCLPVHIWERGLWTMYRLRLVGWICL